MNLPSMQSALDLSRRMMTMRPRILRAVLAVTAATACLAMAAFASGSPPDPHVLVNGAIAAMQGSGVLAGMKSIRAEGIQHEFMLGNAERAEGPWRTFYTQFVELRDGQGRYRRTDRSVGATFSPERVFVASDGVMAVRAAGREAGTNPGAYEDLVDRIDSSPDRALALAAASSELRSEPSVMRTGVVHDVVSFPWRNGRMQIELSRASQLPTAVEIVRPYPHNLRWSAFGDVSIRTEYVNWTLQTSGITWPMQHKVTWNGEPWRDVTVQMVALEETAVAADSFAVGDSAKAQFAAAAWQSPNAFRFGSRGAPVEIAAGITHVPDFWAMTMVKQGDGVILFEAHLSDTYFDEMITEAHRRYPDVPVKAVVITSDPWAHVGGIRQAVARGIPIYAHEASIPFLTRLVKAPHAMAPDLLQRSPRAPKFMAVSKQTVIGTGADRIELFPVGGPYAERMLMAYFPAQRAIYGSDLIFSNRGPDGKPATGFLATPARDLRRAIEREKLSADVIFCVQNGCAWDAAAFMRDESRPAGKTGV